jgi:hypothetical protein
MTGQSVTPSDGDVLARLPADRGGLLRKATVRLLAAALLGVVAARLWAWLDFSPSAVGNRIVQVSLVVLVIPLVLAAAMVAMSGMRQFLAGAWPGFSGVEIRQDRIVLRRGALPSRSYAATDLDLRYLFEMDEDEHNGVFESYLPEDHQRATMLPPLRCAREPEPLRLVLLRWTAVDEPRAAAALAGGLEALRRRYRPDLLQDEDDDEAPAAPDTGGRTA